MQDNHTNLIGRRPVLKGAGVALAGLGGLTGSAIAKKGAGGNLEDTDAGFAVYWSRVDDESNDPNLTDDYGFSVNPAALPVPANTSPNTEGDWFIVGKDDGPGPGLFDGSNIEISPNHKTLHHDFRVFGNFLTDDKAKPYTLVNTGDGVFESRGQTVNFEARPSGEIQAIFAQAFKAQNVPEEQANALAAGLVNADPIETLAGGRWRAVATEQLKVDLSGDAPFDSDWAATRVDFYSRGGGKSEFVLSMLFTLWAIDVRTEILANFGAANTHAGGLITNGRLNHGGK